MRLGISGSHATGKSSLAAELRARLPDYAFLEEAYYYLMDEGHGFGTNPNTDDIEAQLRHSIRLIEDVSDSNVIFERCPVDYLAYLVALNTDRETLWFWVEESRDALATLDALVFVPVEPRDRISVSGEDLPKLRRSVDRVLRNILIEDSWDLNLTVRECHGSSADRAEQVLGSIKAPNYRGS